MKKILKQLPILLVLCLGTILPSQAQSCLKWVMDAGGNNDDGESEGKVIAVSNGYIVCGKTNSNHPAFGVPPGHGNDAYVAKYDVDGNIVWRHIYGGSGEDFFNTVIQTADGGFIAAGHTSSNDGDVSGNHGGNGDAWVVKISASGELQWQKCYGGSNDDVFFSISTEPTGYIITGTTNSRDGDITSWFGDYDVWIVKLSFTGTIAWQSNYGGSNFEESRGIIRNIDGTYTFAGTTQSSNQQVGSHPGGSYDTWVVKISSTGSIIWKKVYGGKGYDECNGIARTSDGNIVLGQSSNSTDGDVNGPGKFAIWLLKINPQSGDIIWSKTFSGVNQQTEACFGIFSTSDGGVVALGKIGTPDLDTWDAFVLAVDGNGNEKWSSSLGGTKMDYAKAGDQSNNNDLIILCSSVSTDGDFAGGSGNPDIWLAKLHNCDNNITKAAPANSIIEANTYKFLAYPNPFSTSTTISFILNQSKKVSLKIFDMNGRLITTLANEEMQAGAHEIKWNVSDANGTAVQSGVYLVRMDAGDFNETRKIFVVK